MKSIAVFVAASLLLEMLAPTLAHATQHSQGTQVEGNTRAGTADVAVIGYHSKNDPKSEQEKEADATEQAVQMFYGKGVMVMSRGEIDPSKLRRGWHAYVVYTSKDVKETVTGPIFDKDVDGIVIKSRARPWERWDIAYEDIDTLAVAKDRRDIERWRRLTEGGLIVMSRGELDLSKLRTGWYADVVYTSEGAKRTITGDILDKDADGIVIQPRGRNWGRWEIAYGNIDILVAAQDPRDMKGWTEVRKVIQQLQEKVSKVRFIAPSISRGWIVGRLVKVSPDTFKIFTERGSEYVPHSLISNLEVRIGRRRNTGKGIIIGLALGLVVVAPAVIGDDSGELAGLAAYYTAMFGFPSIFILSTLIGAAIKSDIWAEVPPQRVNLSISPTPTRGLRAALSFNF